MRSRQPSVRLPAVDRTVDLIELLSASAPGLTFSEICHTTHIPKSSAHYLINTLLSRGYLQRNLDGRTYSIGSRLAAVGDNCEPEHDVQLATTAELQQLARDSGLTAVATVLKRAEAVIVEVAEPSGNGSGGQWKGRHLDVHCTAQGKTLIAQLPDVEIDLLFQWRPLARFTPKTICSLPSLKLHLARIRSEGFALNNEEHIIGTRGVAAPVFNHVGHVITAVGVTGSTQELPQGRIPRLTELVVSAANEISRRLIEALPPMGRNHRF
jgi:IclR family transcriptional regulator, KDG regulon repressor